tara:strand:- start:15288 stop:15476 length:189 start_codon:yes stop_codon:yes gene_type:complete
MSTKAIAGKDPRYIAPQTGDGRGKSLTTTASETYATGKNKLEEHQTTRGGKGSPGKTQGHGG